MIYIPVYSIMFYTTDNNKVILLNNIISKVKNFISSEKPVNKVKRVKPKLRYNRFGFPTYSHRNTKDSELNKNR